MKRRLYYLTNINFCRFCFLLTIILYLTTLITNAQTGTPEINVKRLDADKLSGEKHSFSDQNINTSGSNLTFTIYNTGSANLNITDIALSGVYADQFKLTKPQIPATIAPGGTATFNLAFAPTSTSPEQKNAVLTISNNDSDEGTYVINLTGKAVLLAPAIDASGGINPTSGTAGEAITIKGKNLRNTVTVYFTGVNSTLIAAAFIINSDAEITATVPANAVTGVIAVENATGTNSSTEVFTFLNVYTWNKTEGEWANQDSWNPARSTPASTDILVFDGANGGSTAIMKATLNFTSPQTVGQIKVINKANVTFIVAEDKTLYIGNNTADPDFSVTDQTKLTVTNSVAGADLIMQLMPGETGVVFGSVTFQGVGLAEHRLIADNNGTNKSTLTFQSGSTFYARNNFAGSPFGSDFPNSVQFSSDAIYYNKSSISGSPFGEKAEAVVIFDFNTQYRHDTNTIPDLINRTYGRFIINATAFNQTIRGIGNLTIQRDFTLNAPANAPDPICNLNLDGTITIGKSLIVDRGTLNINPEGAATIKLTGSGSDTKEGTIAGKSAEAINLGSKVNLIIEKDAFITVTKSVAGTGQVTVNGTVRTGPDNINGLSGGSNTPFVNTLPPINYSVGSVAVYNGNGSQTISAGNYANLTISGFRAENSTLTFPEMLKISGAFFLAPAGSPPVYNTTANNNTIEFNGAAQTIPVFNYNNITITGTGNKTLENTVTVNGNLDFKANKLITGTHTLALSEAATVTGEAKGKYVIGTLQTRRLVGSVGSNFGGIGVTLGSGVNVGDVTVIRRAGPGSKVNVDGKEGINRTWEIQPTVPPASPVSLTLNWVQDDDNGKDVTAVRVWKTNDSDISSTFYDVSNADQNALTSGQDDGNRTITATIASFSVFTVSDLNNPLPVELLAFNVARRNNQAILTWQTASEKNNQGFAVEISADAKNFREVGFLKSINSNSATVQDYEFTHRAVRAGTVYYRLKQIDWNGTTTYFGPKAITFDRVTTGLAVYPNPVTDKNAELTILVGGNISGKANLTITDILGKVVYNQSIFVDMAQNEIKVNLSHQPSGVYIISLITAGNASQTRVVKQ